MAADADSTLALVMPLALQRLRQLAKVADAYAAYLTLLGNQVTALQAGKYQT